MSETKNILEVKDLRVSYHTYAGEVQSVRGVSFELETGKALAIVGESGCGKSVTAKSIMGLIKGPAGEIKEGSTILYNGDNIHGSGVATDSKGQDRAEQLGGVRRRKNKVICDHQLDCHRRSADHRKIGAAEHV